jgi:hypothetical protein
MPVKSLYADPVVAELHEVRRRLLEASGGDVEEFRRRLRERERKPPEEKSYQVS